MMADAVKRWIRRRWYFEAAAYLLHNNLLSRLNYSGANLQARPLEDIVSYVRTIALRYRDAAGRVGSGIAGGRFLEIGPGDSLGVALCLVAWGAVEVVCVDRFDCLGGVHERGALYDALLASFSPEEALRARSLCPWTGARPVPHVVTGAVTFLPGHSLETSRDVLHGRTFDAILSNAALEHVQDVDRGLETVMAFLRGGGWMFHEIDFRSHGRFETRSPLWFLTVPDHWWRLMTSRVGAPNRVRPGHFGRLFSRLGFQVQQEVVEAFPRPEAEAILSRVSPTVDALSVEDLVPAVVRYTLRRITGGGA